MAGIGWGLNRNLDDMIQMMIICQHSLFNQDKHQNKLLNGLNINKFDEQLMDFWLEGLLFEPDGQSGLAMSASDTKWKLIFWPHA